MLKSCKLKAEVKITNVATITQMMPLEKSWEIIGCEILISDIISYICIWKKELPKEGVTLPPFIKI